FPARFPSSPKMAVKVVPTSTLVIVWRPSSNPVASQDVPARSDSVPVWVAMGEQAATMDNTTLSAKTSMIFFMESGLFAIVTGLTREEPLLGSGELLVGEHTGVVQLRQLLEFGRQVILCRRRGCILGWGWCILLGRRSIVLWLLLGILLLGIGSTLLVCLVVLVLRLPFLFCIMLILGMVNSTGSTGDHCRANCGAGNAPSNHSSSHHID